MLDRWSLLVCFGVVWAVPLSVAQANADLDRAQQLADEANFDGALAALARAEAGVLSREEVVELLLRRALVHFALGESAAIDVDLVHLAALEPNAVLPPTTPPPVREAFERARMQVGERLGLQVDATREGAQVHFAVHLRGAPEGLVRDVHVNVRMDGGAFTTEHGTEVAISAPPDAQIDYYAELVGAGGATLAAVGTQDEPRRVPILAPSLAVAPSESGSDDALAWGLGISGGVVAVAVAVVLAVVLTQPAQADTQFSGPRVVP